MRVLIEKDWKKVNRMLSVMKQGIELPGSQLVGFIRPLNHKYDPESPSWL